jgi:mannan endo-1,4-beta-mannosidase
MQLLDLPAGRAPRARLPRAASATALPWIHVAPDAPYFVTDEGDDWTPVGQNDAVTWPELAGLFRRRDVGGVELHLDTLVASGVTCLRLMLEYAQGEHRYLERPAGRFVPGMVRLWDDMFALCERRGLRLLLTPFDTFFMWNRWGRHPYNRRNGGPCDRRTRWLVCPETRAAIKRRLAFATGRWGASGALFAWDLWNEIHPAHAGNDAGALAEFVSDVGGYLRDVELRLHGRAHLQTVSVFGPSVALDPRVAECALGHPALDAATVHFYETGTIDAPRNTVDAAVSFGRLTSDAIARAPRGRPFFDSEHGPIHSFKDRKRTLPAPFDDEYFRHMQWAHLASGGAGGGMRWPNRNPHTLTPGMRAAQRALAGFLPLIDWSRFRRESWTGALRITGAACAGFACGDGTQAVVWLLRTDTIGRNGMLRRDAPPAAATMALPLPPTATYDVTAWDTAAGRVLGTWRMDGAASTGGESLRLQSPPFVADVALAIRRVG